MSVRDEKIGPTAHYTAYTWKRLGLPYADLFATDTGALLFWGFRLAGEWAAVVLPGVPSMAEYLGLRHRLIDAEIERIAPDRIVELGAGLSRRGVTWAADHATSYVEVDLPHMIGEKREALRHAPPELQARLLTRLRHEPRDVLSPELGAWLAGILQGAARPLVVAEGLLGYFAEDERLRVARSVRDALAAAGGGTFLCDLRAREGGARVAAAASVLRAGIRLATRGRGAGKDFASHAAIRAFFGAAGFDAAEPVDPSAVPELAHVVSPARIWRADVGSRADLSSRAPS